MFSRKIRILPAMLAVCLFAGFACESDDDDDKSTPAPMVGGSPMTPGLSLVGTVVADERFSTLKTALEKAELVNVLDQGEFTVFAPTNEAFAALGEATLNSVLADKALLTSILLYHVVPGTVKAQDVLAAKSLKTANEGLLTPEVVNGQAYISGAKILQTDVQTKNGVIHVIDKVLLPPAQ